MWMNAAATTAVSTAARTCWEVTAVAVLRATCSTTSGTSVWVSCCDSGSHDSIYHRGTTVVITERCNRFYVTASPYADVCLHFFQMKTSVRQEQCAALPPATTRWAASSACVPLALTLSRASVAAKM